MNLSLPPYRPLESRQPQHASAEPFRALNKGDLAVTQAN
jgi:hypothetical protein